MVCTPLHLKQQYTYVFSGIIAIHRVLHDLDWYTVSLRHHYTGRFPLPVYWQTLHSMAN